MSIIIEVLGGLGVFLLGMKNMSEGMQAISGPVLRNMINKATSNRFMAVGMGTLMTCMVQSSSITTVMVVGLVNVGVMNLTQAFGVIMGANIGTTITGWVLVLKIGKYGLPLLGISAMFHLFTKNERIRYVAMALMGLGMVFFGLELMKNGFKPLAKDEAFIEWFSRFSYDGSYFSVLKCALVGAVLTGIVQSSSATLGITIGLATSGIIDYHTAAALVLGENIGTTVTALLASIGGTITAKRASYSHMLFNLLGVLWITAVFGMYSTLIVQFTEWWHGGSPNEMVMAVVDGVESETYPHVTAAIAATHTGFNVANVILFLPFMGAMTTLLRRIVPDSKTDVPGHLTYFDMGLVHTPAFGLEQSMKEIEDMADGCAKMMARLRPEIESDESNVENERKIFNREEVLDLVQKEISEFVSHLLTGNVPQEVVDDGHRQILMADEFESISDYIVKILKLSIKMQKTEQVMSEQNRAEILDLHDKVNEYLLMVIEAVKEDNEDIVAKARTRGDAVTHLMKQYRANHVERVGTLHTSPMESLAVTDMLNSYRRIKDHAFNIAEAVSREK